MDMDTIRSNAVVLEGFLFSVAVETAIVAAKSLACSLLMVWTIWVSGISLFFAMFATMSLLLLLFFIFLKFEMWIFFVSCLLGFAVIIWLWERWVFLLWIIPVNCYPKLGDWSGCILFFSTGSVCIRGNWPFLFERCVEIVDCKFLENYCPGLLVGLGE